MITYFVRHTSILDIDEPTRRMLWESHRIAIHFPHDNTGATFQPPFSMAWRMSCFAGLDAEEAAHAER